MTFLEGEAFVLAIYFFVGLTICIQEVAVSGLGIPEVDGEVVERAGGILLELSSPKMGIA